MWRTVEINPKYEVSDDGKVRTKATGHIKAVKVDRYGYEVVCLSETRTKRSYPTVHRLVAMAFIPNADRLPQVNHKDENKRNNSVENLEWCTGRYNTLYGTGKARGAEKIKRKAVAYKDGIKVAEFSSVREAAKAMNTQGSQISAAITGRQKTCRGYSWKHE